MKRYNLLAQIMKTYEAEVKNGLMKDVIDYGILGLKNSNMDIRKEGCKFLVEAYRMVGKKIEEHLATLLPTQRKMLSDELVKTFGKDAAL